MMKDHRTALYKKHDCPLKGALQANLSFYYLLILHDFSKDAVTGSQQDNDTTGIKFPFDSESRFTSQP